MNIKYLGNHAERISQIGDLKPGEIYVVGRGKDAFIAFVMPDEAKTKKIDDRSYTFNGIPVYEARLKGCGQEIDSDRVDLDDVHVDEFLDVELMGVFRPTEGSTLRKTIVDKLGTPDEEKEVA